MLSTILRRSTTMPFSRKSSLYYRAGCVYVEVRLYGIVDALDTAVSSDTACELIQVTLQGIFYMLGHWAETAHERKTQNADPAQCQGHVHVHSHIHCIRQSAPPGHTQWHTTPFIFDQI